MLRKTAIFNEIFSTLSQKKITNKYCYIIYYVILIAILTYNLKKKLCKSLCFS